MNILNTKKIYGFAAALLVSAALAAPVQAELTPEMLSKVKVYEQKLVTWTKNPVLVNAVKEANAGGAIAGLTNARLLELPDDDAVLVGMMSNSAAQLLKKFEGENQGVSKLILRDAEANVVATSTRPLLYNNKTKDPFVHGIKGEVWHADEVKPDPATQVKGVHLTAPIKDGAKVIGILHTSVIAD